MRKTKEGRVQYDIRYKSAKNSAKLINGIVTDINKIAGVKLTAEQIHQLAGQFRSFDSSYERANEAWSATQISAIPSITRRRTLTI
jgi:hypothetical protein